MLQKKPKNMMPIPVAFGIQTRRYFEQGIYKVVGISLLISCFVVPYWLGVKYWPLLEQWTGGSLWWFWLGFMTPLTIVQPMITHLFYLGLYLWQNPFLEQFKITPGPWPWETDPEFKPKLYRAFKVVGFNVFVLIPLFNYVGVKYDTLNYRMKHEEIPNFFVFCIQVIFMTMCEDFMFYHTHRLLHHPKLYPLIHKEHHKFFDTIVIASMNALPLEFLFANALPTTLGAILLNGRAHVLSQIAFSWIRLIETAESHGGYEFPWAVTRFVPLSITTKMHHYHHSHNVGCFATFFTIWDSIYGTHTDYYEHTLGLEEEENKNRKRD